MKKVFLGIFLAFVLCVVGLFAQLPVIPWIETEYYFAGVNKPIGSKALLGDTAKSYTTLEIPSYFPEAEKCFDFRFSSVREMHNLTVDSFSLKVFNKDGIEIKKINSYMFSDSGSKAETFNIKNHQIAKSDTTGKDRYVFFRTVVDVNNTANFLIRLKVHFFLDNLENSIDTSLVIEKKHRLTWNKFRLH